ncbi:hypothetical protein MNB_SUP05-5-1067 [hydrothermal vent metagenome]|uniref:Uncharacterized protein n=1 Tax=hydrothermal vent metagenome TaxID=652676 RepID=A0A1W1CHN7_9ZZZZ
MNKEKKLKNALVGYGFSPDLVCSLKGDSSLRNTVYNRERVHNFVDKNIKKLTKIFKCLLLETGVHRLSIGFNNGEIKTFSIFDPLNMEIHTAQNILDKDYLLQNFPKINLKEKDLFIKRLYKNLVKDEVFLTLPIEWQQSLYKRNQQMNELTNINQLSDLLKTLPKLRDIEGYYLRTATISLFNSTIALSFNCDGTQIMAHNAFEDFIKENI